MPLEEIDVLFGEEAASIAQMATEGTYEVQVVPVNQKSESTYQA
jgi:hypothetical protein